MGSGAFVRALERKRHPIPLVSLCLSAVSALLFLVPSAAAALEYDRVAIGSGQVWRLVTGHLVHYSFDHFFWDTITFGILAVVCERKSDRRFVGCLFTSAVLISLALWFCAPSIDRYRGLSGVDSALFALLAAELFIEGIRSATRQQVAVAATCLTGFLLKTAFELATSHTLFVTSLGSGAVGVPVAHLVGAATGLMASSRRFVFCSSTRMPFWASFSTLPRMIRPVKPVRPSDRLRLTFTNQNPRPRAGS
jgi:rhomboid family GlyGly-CTERM serine protease